MGINYQELRYSVQLVMENGADAIARLAAPSKESAAWHMDYAMRKARVYSRGV